MKLHKFIIFFLLFIFAVPYVSALTQQERESIELLNTTAQNIGYEASSDFKISGRLGNIVQIILGFLGVIALVINLYAGYLWMTAGGNDEQVKKAKSWLKNGIIGLTLILMSYLIVNYLLENL